MLETTKSNYLIIEGEYNSKNIIQISGFNFVKVPHDIERELKGENLNIESDNYRFELKEGKYRDMSRINEILKGLVLMLRKYRIRLLNGDE